MLESVVNFLEWTSDYILQVSIAIAALLLGGIAGWLMYAKLARKNNLGKTYVSQGTYGESPRRAPSYEDTILVENISSELDKIEANLSIQRNFGPNRPAHVEKLRSTLLRLQTIAHTIRNKETTAPSLGREAVMELSRDPDVIPTPAEPPSFEQEFTEMYNSARDDKQMRDAFWSKYQLAQLGNRNTTDQRMGRASSHDFRTADSLGDFIAVEDSFAGAYLVVPSFTMSVDDTSFRFGGLDAAFACNFEAGVTYPNFTVLVPAKFSRNIESWDVATRGQLELHPPDQV